MPWYCTGVGWISRHPGTLLGGVSSPIMLQEVSRGSRLVSATQEQRRGDDILDFSRYPIVPCCAQPSCLAWSTSFSALDAFP